MHSLLNTNDLGPFSSQSLMGNFEKYSSTILEIYHSESILNRLKIILIKIDINSYYIILVLCKLIYVI